VRRIQQIPPLARLDRAAHKGDRGRVLLVAGSLGMSGAARLAAWGALRGGAGLVTVACPDAVQLIVAADLPCALTLPLASRKGILSPFAATEARAAAENADAVAVGPGLTPEVLAFLRRFLKAFRRPLVLDADALNALAADPSLLDGVEAPRILTPHPGEAARLLGRAVPEDPEGRAEVAALLAEQFHCTAVLKGPGTVVCDGESVYVNASGNPGMATGGTGDVLTGLIAARFAAGADPFKAAVQAVALHGRAGDLAAAAVGQNAMMATDLISALPNAVLEALAPAVARPPKTTASRRPRRRRGR